MKNEVIPIIAVLLWETGIYFLSADISNNEGLKYQLCARYSARTSFFMLLAMLFWIGIQRLSKIYGKESTRTTFVSAMLCFAINHLIHFVYIVLHYRYQQLSLLKPGNIFGAIGYLGIIILPIYLLQKKSLTKERCIAIHIMIYTTTLIFLTTYLGRLSKELPFPSPPLFYDLCLFLILFAVAVNILPFLTKYDGRK
ncbi:hypothetical protein SAMN05421820_101855 [Pedobacter steynii]|uniref:Uncharacterized protein n=1 Tax=Pedobacter steynii TaxID=430522 RepID=A0A1G9LDI3_9SPHI|nr:hypothetical protein SAMN05421820_101855 [Pedobacter steynii]